MKKNYNNLSTSIHYTFKTVRKKKHLVKVFSVCYITAFKFIFCENNC